MNGTCSNMEDYVSMPTALLVSVLALGGGIVTAWSDVKSDVAVNDQKHEQTEKRYDEIQKKLDRIYEYMLEQRRNDQSNSH